MPRLERNPQKLAAEIRQRAGGTIFSACFKKRTDGSIRTMSCRLGVKKHLRGGDQAYDPKDHDLLTVWDVGKRAYRVIPLDSLLWVQIRGRVWKRR